MPKEEEDVYQSFSKALDALGPFEPSPTIAVAVSGGVDSLALTFLAHQWVQEKGGQLVALHVDHRLRNTSTKEAEQVQAWLQARKIPCTILPWFHGDISSSIQEQARNARYDFLTTYCKEKNILHLFLAHHQNDQAETFFYRQSKGSGVEGLAGMSSIEEGSYVRILRPLLGIQKSALHHFLRDHPFIQDPSNTNDKFWRAQFRKNPNTSSYDDSFGEQRTALEKDLALLLAEHVALHPEGYATLNKNFAKDTSPALQEKMLGKILTTVGGHGYPIRSRVVSRIIASMPTQSWVSAGGCLIRLKGNHYQIIREWGRIQDVRLSSMHSPFLWDGRFVIKPTNEIIVCKTLGENGWQQLNRTLGHDNIPALVFYGLPAFFGESNRLISLAQASFMPKNRLLRGLWTNTF